MKRSEIWLADLNPARGAEMQKKRPVLIVSADEIGKLPLRVVVPITSWQEKFSTFPWFVEVPAGANSGLRNTSGIDCFQVRSLSTKRFVKKLGILSTNKMQQVERALQTVLALKKGNID